MKLKHISESKIIAVDLDGTISQKGQWKGDKHFDKVRPGVKKALKKLKDKGIKIIIFTVRGDKQAIKKYLTDNDIPFDYINQSPIQPKGSSHKVQADLYIDDKAIDATRDWEQITKDIEKRLDIN